jgi:hypothetical protein
MALVLFSHSLGKLVAPEYGVSRYASLLAMLTRGCPVAVEYLSATCEDTQSAHHS